MFVFKITLMTRLIMSDSLYLTIDIFCTKVLKRYFPSVHLRILISNKGIENKSWGCLFQHFSRKVMYSIYNKSLAASFKEKELSSEKAYLETNGANWEWYDPDQNGTPVNFCLDTSLHGLKYLGQGHRHLCERVFWFVAFTAAVITSSLLIWEMWTVYRDMPIVTVFSPTEKTIADIPFPAVTICNVNNVRKSHVEKYQKEFISNLSSHTSEDWKRAKIALMDLEHICETAKPFTQRFIKNDLMDVLAEHDRANILRNLTANSEDLSLYSNPNLMLHEGSQKCKEMILLCIWLDQVRNCSYLFQEIETDFGYCCTFNTIPLTLLSKFLNFTSDSPQKVEEWRKADLNTENLLHTPETSKRRFPRRQLHPGRSAGLSILLDPDLHEYFCPNIDSEGFVVAVNMPLDFPRMKDNGVAVLPNSEVFIDVRPDITMSAESIKQFPLEKRQCYFAGEFPLDHYSKYTTSNCMDECIAYRTMERCSCVQYYMPRSPKDPICKPEQYNCTYQIRTNITQDGLGETCSKCLPTCTEIVYQTDATSLPIRNESIQKLFKEYPHYSAAHQVSIVHVYFSVDSVYPRMRKELYTIIDLLSNTGGLLGLCMGFSFLSLLEIVYYFSVRIFFILYRRKSKLKQEMTDPENETIISIKDPRLIKPTWVSRVCDNSDLDNKSERHRLGNILSGHSFKVNPSPLPAYYSSPFELQSQYPARISMIRE